MNVAALYTALSMDTVTPWLAAALPLVLALGALGARGRRSFSVARITVGLATTLAMGLAMGLAATLAMGLAATLAMGLASVSAPTLDAASARALAVRVDALTVIPLLLVTGLGLVLVRFSDRYLDGDPGRPRYARWLLATLAAVTALIVTDHLLLLALAWTATSLCLHQLLTFYAQRPNAHVAAHHKFLVSRLADVCTLAAVVLVRTETGSFRLQALEIFVDERGASAPLQVAAVLVAAAIALKSAQLPFHGWLLRVMEAPTPVSALLHAGVVNIGGLVAIRAARLLEAAPAALALLVTVGTATMVVSALAARTRTSVKSSLAWSTSAQMGFMLVQCGLGAWDLALLHLVAHSLYKAHAFLGAGGAVAEARRFQLAEATTPSLRRVLMSGAVACLGVSGVAVGAHFAFGAPFDATDGALVLFVAASLAMPLARVRGWPAATLGAVGFAALYFAWHTLFALVAPSAGLAAGWPFAALGLATLALLHTALETHPKSALGRLAGRLGHLGVVLDARFTQWAFRAWQPRPSRESGAATLARPREV